MRKKINVFIGLFVFTALLAIAAVAYNRIGNRTDAPDNLLLIEAVTDEPRETAYDFTVHDVDGNEVRLSDFFGRPIVLNFWTTWCPSCVQSSPYFEQLYREMGDDIHMLKINLPGGRETRQAVDDFIAANGYTLPVYFDAIGEAARAYSIRAIPDTVFINADGNIIARIVGAINESTLQEAVSLLLSQ
ncbi:MAG: TlpA family protein disulfide reductase [Defluviitaleaceae bacterium]|nr:TlpA family protein disulfide reductase [Defluviitaleaceae bacterium]